MEEADASIDNAYKEGYKLATVELKPEIEYWKSRYETRKKNALNNDIKFALIGFGSGFVMGSFTGFSIGTRFTIN